MGAGLPFRSGVFDGAISISALQWLCNADRSDHIPQLRLKKFFGSLYATLRRGARAVFQFYPANKAQLDMIVRGSERSGFTGGLVVDYPNSTRAKKYYLVLFAGPSSCFTVPACRTGMEGKHASESSSSSDDDDDEGANMDDDDDDSDMLNSEDDEDEKTAQDARLFHIGNHRPVRITERQKRGRRSNVKQLPLSSRDWVKWKKEQRRAKGVRTVADTKYTGRKRSSKF
eukprot:NODE_2539_length_775_cov_181.557851_g1770_i0.p1 GENE.NODE_2539_length_775_cov_181.557851_g1770_i0~~NODE_2539_length_775_cov_181.557851_g1770_i0.p1  ORF type:complete len:241 (-),score=84.59 NODE_2539_length_775_cov_181.557851_g1770_i0:53-739(-)